MLSVGLVATVLWLIIHAARSAAGQRPNFLWHATQLLLALCAVAGITTGTSTWTQNHYGHRFDTPMICGELLLIFASVIGLSIYAQRWNFRPTPKP